MRQTNLEKKQIDLIRESICAYLTCMECKDLFKAGKLSFKSIEDFVDDRGRSCLFRLKEMCHALFRNSDEASAKEKLYDMTVGIIFHEAMILRENLYQLEYYRPKSDIATDALTNVERKIVREIGTLIQRTDKKLKVGLRGTWLLLGELVEQLKDLIRLYKSNYLLPRFIFENEKSLIRMYGRKGFAELLRGMYEAGRPQLMLKAAKSYLDSEYYDSARRLFHKVANLDNRNRDALFLYMYSSAFHYYFKNMFSKAKGYADRAGVMGMGEGELRPYSESLRRLDVDLSREMKRKKKS